MNLTFKKILILGSAGYLGVPLFKYLDKKGYCVFGIDEGIRQRNVISIGSDSLTYNENPSNFRIDISNNYKELSIIINGLKPDTIIHLAEQPSAPFSTIDAEHSTETQRNNVMGTLNVLWAIKEFSPKTHLIKLGTAGEYTDWLYNNIEVPESSRINVSYQGNDWEIPTPRYAGSWYHWSKVHDSNNIDYACRIWGIRATDLNQGIVYGHIDGTRFDYDEYFGTVVNRFVTQAIIGMPLTIYGTGGQMRSFININNVIQAIELVINNPAKDGEFKVLHQLTETHKVGDIAKKVSKLTGAKIQNIDNPRIEMKENTFKFEAKELKTLGLKTITMDEELPNLIKMVEEYKDKINKDVIMPKHSWK